MIQSFRRSLQFLNLNKRKAHSSLQLSTKMPKSKAKKVLQSNPKPVSEITIPDIEDSFTTPAWEPENWKTILENIRKMRATSKAPVDTMGCHKCADENADEKTQHFHKLVALMLSSQTKDEITFEAMQRLKKHGLTPKSVFEMETVALQDLLKPVSFYKNKAKYLQKTSQILIEKYGSDIPRTIKELVALPGVGPKMAHICMATAWNEISGIGVDVHVHRISNRLNWVHKKTKEPEQTRIALEEWLPRDLWREVNELLVGFGQTICTAVRPHCNQCLNRNICPSAEKGVRKNFTASKNAESDEIKDETAVTAALKKAKHTQKKMKI